MSIRPAMVGKYGSSGGGGRTESSPRHDDAEAGQDMPQPATVSSSMAPMLLDNADDGSDIVNSGGENWNDNGRDDATKAAPGRRRRRLVQTTTITIYLLTWVANGEMLQGLSNGLLCPNSVPYDQPAFTTWFSYNYMTLSFGLVVLLYVKLYRKWSLSYYVRRVWAGRLGVRNAVGACAVISYSLQILNVTFILGLECISVTLSNAVYQLQTAFTVRLSACLLRDEFCVRDAAGILVSAVGVCMVVLPPLLDDQAGDKDAMEEEGVEGTKANHDHGQQYARCSFDSAPMTFGILATLLSAGIGGAYLVSWRVFDERRLDLVSLDGNTTAAPAPANNNKGGRLAGFIDTHMTLSTIGLCNLVFGWPLVSLLHLTGLDSIHLPPTAGHWSVLHWNGVVEYAFDASCAAAIYVTSPVVTAIVAPLTIPLSLVADGVLWGTSGVATSSGNGFWMWLGAIIILVGVILLETKPDMHFGGHGEKKYGKGYKKMESEALLV